jgi:hypothetical protein
MNTTTQQKKAEVQRFIQQEVLPEPSVRGIVVIGSVAKGIAQADSDIDAVVFLEPVDLFALPAEFKWRPEDGSFHGIFSDVKDSVQFDFHRVDLHEWRKPTYVWPESICAELSEGWLAFDRDGTIQELIAERTIYREETFREGLDDAVVNLDGLLNDAATQRTWEFLGVNIAHDRLNSAYEFLVQALFAYNRCWRTLRSRELTDLVKLPWLPGKFQEQWLPAANALSATQDGYRQRVALLRQFFDELVAKCQLEGLYGPNPVNEAFIRSHDEPGRDWNMKAWNQRHRERKL